MKKTLAEIAQIIGGEVVGDENILVTGLNSIKEARDGDLTFLSNPKYFSLAKTTKASAIITSRGYNVPGKAVILADNPSVAFSKIIAHVSEKETLFIKGIHKSAVIAEDVFIGENVAIGANAVIEKKTKVGKGTVVHAGCFIGNRSVIGLNCLIHPNVTIYDGTVIGDNVIIHSGSVIGSDGFGFDEIGEGYEKIPQIGIVEIADDVEIGANVTIDRARFDKTFIGRGTKIDNLVQIGHNVQIGEHCIIVAQVGISGSTIVKDRVILAGQSGLVGHITIGENSIVASKAQVAKSIPAGSKVSGFPARPHTQVLKSGAYLQRLPGIVKSIARLKERITSLEKKLDDLGGS